MSKNKAPEVQAPEGLRDPGRAFDAIRNLESQGERFLSTGLLTDPVLGDSVSLNSDVSRLAMEVFKNQFGNQFRRSRQDLVNQLEGLGALTSSTTADALSQLELGVQEQLAAVGGQATLNDINRALENRIRLTGLGLDATQAAGSLDLSATQVSNAKVQQEFENRLAAQTINEQNRSGGFTGGLLGGLGGALGGFATGGPVGAVIGGIGGGLGGFTGPSGTGGQILNAGAGLAGNFLTGDRSTSSFNRLANTITNQNTNRIRRFDDAINQNINKIRRFDDDVINQLFPSGGGLS